MLLPQMAIFAQGTRAHYFLEFEVLPDVSPSQAVSAFARLRAPEASSGGVNFVIAFGPDLWSRVASDGDPDDFKRLEPIATPCPRRRTMCRCGSAAANPT